MKTLYFTSAAEDVLLQGGGVLKKGTRLQVWADEGESTLGVSWTDRDGNHAMALDRRKTAVSSADGETPAGKP